MKLTVVRRNGKRFLPLLALILALLLLPAAVRAQVPDPVTAAAAPVPGSGHSYIGQPGETVNPATGVPSFSLSLRTPAGRVLSLPFGIRYSGAEPFSTGRYLADGSNFRWYLSPSASDHAGGWSYSLPELTMRGVIASEAEIPGSTGGPGGPTSWTYQQCDATTDYIFTGLDGVQHSLPIGIIAPDSQGDVGTQCDSATSPGNAEGVLSSTAAPPSGTDFSGSDPVTVTGASGTVYQFDGTGQGNLVANDADVYNWWIYPTTITGRNGNQLHLLNVSGSVANGYVDELGRTLVSWSGLDGSSGDTITVAGMSSPVTLHWTTVTPSSLPGGTQSLLGTCTFGGTQSGSFPAVSEIDLPDAQKYTFQYNPANGLLDRINYPGGGYVRYVWGVNTLSAASDFGSLPFTVLNSNNQPIVEYTQECINEYDMPAVTDRYVSFDGTNEVLHQHFDYNTQWDGLADGYWTQKTTTVTSTDLTTGQVTKTIYTYGWVATPQGLPFESSHRIQQVPVETQVQYEDGNGNVLRTVHENWANVREQTGHQTVLDNGQASTTLTCYNSDEQVFETAEYGFQRSGGAGSIPGCASTSGLLTPGPLLRTTTTVYHDFIAASPSTHIVDAPDSITVADGSGTTVKQTDLTYGEAVTPSNTTSGLVAPPALRGNITAVARWVNTSSSWLTTNYAWYDTGQLSTRTDPANNTTTFTYDDSPGSPGTHAYLTQVQFPDTSDPTLAHHIESFTWDHPTGHLVTRTGQNGNVTQFTYSDSLGRLTNITYPSGGGQTNISYSDVPNDVSMDVQRQIDASRWTDTKTLYDGMGHAISTGSANGEATPNDRVDTCLDGFGRVLWKSYPFQSSSQTGVEDCANTSSLPAGDTFAYDALGRPTTVTHPDGSQISTSYAGAATQVMDEGNTSAGSGGQRVTRILQHDGLGRLISVCEVSGQTGAGTSSTPAACNQDIAGTGFLTSYQYDTLGNLTQVNQGAETRSFTYDSLSRLTSSDNPEANTDPSTGGQVATQYSYDTVPSGQYCASIGAPPMPGELVQKTDARGVSTCYWYDQLHRLTLKRSSDDPQQVRNVTLQYDLATTSGFDYTNGIGRLTTEWVGSTPNENRDYAYNAMGWVTQTAACAPSNCFISSFWVTAQYDLLGDVTQLTYPSGRVVQTQYNLAGRPTAVTGAPWGTQTNSVPYLTGATYTAAGQPSAFTLGNGSTDSFGYDPRQRLDQRETTSSAGTLLNLNFTDAPDSDVLNSVDLINAVNDQSYAYGALNRLATATSGAWGVSEVYDRYGNRWQQNVTGGAAPSPQVTFSAADNRMDAGTAGYQYDASGDLTFDGTNTYCYDAQGQVLTVVPGVNGDCSSTTPLASYYYDAEGDRVEKQVSGTVTDYAWWQGRLLAERTGPLNDSTWHDYIYAGGRRIARATNQVNRLVVGGTDCSTCGWQASTYTFPTALSNYVIQSGDTLWLRQWQEAGTHGGVTLWFTDGTNSNWVTTDSSGQVLDDDQTDGQWLTRKVDLSQWAGKTVGGFSATQEGDTQAGAWQIQYEDIVLQEANGTVVPIYTGQSSVSLNVWQYSSSSADSYSVTAAALPDASTGEDDSTIWYHTDQVGTTRLITNTDGYPVWQGTFLPFGEELNEQPIVSDFKFTGKQRDEETGLDYFGARYDFSQLGRFMTPDPFSPFSLSGSAFEAWIANPQHWNKYAYVLNNPVTLVDPNGMNACGGSDDSKCNVTITVTDRVKGSDGKYHDQYSGIKGNADYNAVASVTVNGKPAGTFLASSLPSNSYKYATLADGTYSGTLVVNYKGTGNPAILLNGGSEVPTVGSNPSRRDGADVAVGILVHKAGLISAGFPLGSTGRISGSAISRGCQMICSSEYPDFLQEVGIQPADKSAPQHVFTVVVDTTENTTYPGFIEPNPYNTQ